MPGSCGHWPLSPTPGPGGQTAQDTPSKINFLHLYYRCRVVTYLLSIFLFIFSDTILPPAPSPSCCWPIPVCGPLFLVSPGWRGSGQEGIGNIVFLVVSCGQSFMWSLRCCESALWKVFLGRAGRGRPVLGHQVGAVLLVERAEVEGQVEMQRYLRLWELPRPSQGPLPRPRR